MKQRYVFHASSSGTEAVIGLGAPICFMGLVLLMMIIFYFIFPQINITGQLNRSFRLEIVFIMPSLIITYFFLKYVKKEKNLKELDNEKKEEFDIKKTKSMDYIAKIYNSVNKILDKMLKSRQSVLLVSLVLSLILFITLAGGDVVSTTTSGKVIKEVAVKVEGLKDGYEVSGIPTNVNIMLVGPSIDIYTAQLTKNYEVYADLSGYSEGVHTISLRTRNFSNDLKVSVVPETSSITISKTISKNFKLGYEFINQNELNEKYAVSMKELSKDTVKVEASKATLSKIDHVNALINVSDKLYGYM